MNYKHLLITSVVFLTACGTSVDTLETRDAQSSTEATEETTNEQRTTLINPLDLDASSMEWTGSRVDGVSFTGTMDELEGEAFFEDGDLVGGEFTINMDSMNIDNQGLLDHLKNEDFFDVEKFKTATFKITEVGKLNPNNAKQEISGDLTIKGITKNITFTASITETNEIYGAVADFAIDRTDWDIKYGSGDFFDDLGDKAIKNEIEFKLNIVTKKV